MVEEVVVTNFLSDQMIAAGKELLHQLDQERFGVSAALWSYLSESGVWRLIIAHPKLKSEGPLKAYGKIQSALGKIPADSPRISLQDVTVVDSKERWIASLRAAVPNANGGSGLRLFRSVVDGILVDDVYIYRLTKNGH